MRIPIESLNPETLKRVVEEFVTREGTDYGLSTSDLDKVEQVLRQLKKGEALLFFDEESETCQIMPKTHPMFREYTKDHSKENDLSLN